MVSLENVLLSKISSAQIESLCSHLSIKYEICTNKLWIPGFTGNPKDWINYCRRLRIEQLNTLGSSLN